MPKRQFTHCVNSVVLIFALCFVVPLSSAKPQLLEIYVSPQGNDAWSGLLVASNSTLTDGPVRTLERAREIVRRLKITTNGSNTAIQVNLREGTYVRSQPFVLDETDSGTQAAPIVWQNYNDERVQIIGGVEISGFTSISQQGVLNKLSNEAITNTLQLDLKSLGVTDYGEITSRGSPGFELFFNDKRMTLARWPNEGWVNVDGVPQTGNMVYQGSSDHLRDGNPLGRHFGRFSFSQERPLTWSNTEDIALHGYWCWDWFDEFLTIKAINKVSREITLKEPYPKYGLCSSQRYYALNILEELDQPGEWYLDRNSGILYFWPPKALSQGRAYISTSSTALWILDKAEYISVQGLTFEFSRASAVEINGGKDNHITDCTVRNISGTAVVINGGVNNGISSCDIHDISSGGIRLTGGDRRTLTPANNFAVNNHIYNLSSWIRTYQPAITITGVGNRIAHNEIHDAPHAAIILNGNEHIIEYNDIYRVAQETRDVGAFYMGRDWTQRGNIVRYNYFHELGSSGDQDVNAIYLDDWSSDTQIYGNVIYKVGLGVKIGGGRDNIVRNNLFIDDILAIRVDSRGLGWAGYFFDGTNTTLFDRMDEMNYSDPPFSETYPELLTLYDDEPAVAKNNRIFNNISSGDKWLHLHDGLDLNTVNVHDNVVFQTENDYQNERDTVLFNRYFIDIVDDEITLSDEVTLQPDFEIPDLRMMGNYDDGDGDVK